jgi:SAM-dependent methyltransferase/TolA-binding protein
LLSSQLQADYAWDDEFHLSRRTNASGFAYSDGVEAEERLLRVVSAAGDRSTFSGELAQAIVDWPSEYHFSRLRHCLVRPLGIPPEAKVLELGCGCGAVTRFLGELGAEVVAVEGSLARARVAAQRCRDLRNVHVFVDDLLRFETAKRFDFVLLIGVLEYAPVFSDQNDPVQHYLRSVRRFLAPGGRLVVAIENKLGLKYFNGCGEDHVNVPFFGIQDLYRKGTARTFGRRELTEQLAAAGFPYSYFYYPFPDYKVPSVVLSEDALVEPGFDPVDLLARCHSRDYLGRPFRAFDEALASWALYNNGLLADFSNSFLVVAAAEPAEKTEADLAVAYSAIRSREFATQTRVVRCGSTIKVLKERLQPSAERHYVRLGNTTFTQETGKYTYTPGRQLTWKVLAGRASTGDLETILDALVPWMEYLLQHARRATRDDIGASSRPTLLASYVVAGDMLDCTTFNLIDTRSGLVPIDMEWKASSDLPLGWIVTRGVAQALSVGGPHGNPPQSVAQVVEALCSRVDLVVSDSEVRQWTQHEINFQMAVLGHPVDPLSVERTSSGLRSFVNEIESLDHQAQEQASQIAGLQGAAEKLEQQMILLQRVAQTSVEQARQARLQAAELTAQLEQLRHDLEKRTEQLNAALCSRSWRLSSPLRAIGRLRLNEARKRRQTKDDAEMIAKSGLFEAAWYLIQNPDVAEAGTEPVSHYLDHGASEGRDPSPLFNTRWYLEQYADVRAAGMNPLVHYLRFGRAEGRKPAPSGSRAGGPGRST